MPAAVLHRDRFSLDTDTYDAGIVVLVGAGVAMAIQYTEALDRTFHALGDASRRRMLGVISKKGACTAGELVALFDTAQPTISRHLRVLEDADLVQRRIEGRNHVFTIAPARMRQAQKWMERHLAFWEGSLDQLEGVLEELKRTQNRNDRE